MQPVSSNQVPVLVGVPDILEAGNVIRRRLPGELASINDFLLASPMHDPLSEQIRAWHSAFSARAADRGADYVEVLGQFLQVLSEILVNPIQDVPLDEQAWLGSDGLSYANNWYCLYLHRVDAAFRNRSPLTPNDGIAFTVTPHTVARFMVAWIRSFVPDFRSLAIEAQFHDLPAMPTIPVAVDPVTARAREMIARRPVRPPTMAERVQAAASSSQAQPVDAPTPQQRVITPELSIDVDQIVAEILQNATDRLQQFVIGEEQYTQAAGERLNRATQVEAEQRAGLREDIAEADRNIASRQEEIRQLERQLTINSETLNDAKRASINLKIATNQLRNGIEELKQKNRKSLIKAIVTVVVVVVICIIAAETGAPVGAQPVNGGGARINFNILKYLK